MKRTLDILLSASALLCLSPVFAYLWIRIGKELGSPVLFTQPRIGLDNKIFHLVKFRSMTTAVDVHGEPLPDDQRLTAFGRRLRASSLDELPTLFNVLSGTMSLVGPRPLLVEYLPLYTDEQARRHYAKPGITGWAQINGRNSVSWTEKFQLDTWYVDNQSLALDIKILFLTVGKVLKRDGISADGQATMSKFTGVEEDS